MWFAFGSSSYFCYTLYLSIFNYVVSWTLEGKSTVIIFPERTRTMICRMHEQVSKIVTYLLYAHCFCPHKNLHVETLPPNVMVFGGKAFGTQLALDEVKRTSFLCLLRTRWQGGHLQTRKKALTRTRPFWYPDLGLAASGTVRKFISGA